MTTVNLTTISDKRLMREILIRVSRFDGDSLDFTQDDDAVLGALGVEMAKRIKSVGFEDNKLTDDCLFFDRGMSELDIDHFIRYNLGMYIDSLESLISYIDLTAVDFDMFHWSIIDARKSLIIGYSTITETWDDLVSGVVPLDPFSEAVLHCADVLAMSDGGLIIHLTSSMPAEEVVARVLTEEQALKLLEA